jgi:hypothetical protein
MGGFANSIHVLGERAFTAELIMPLAQHTQGMKISAMLTEQNS